MADADLPLYEIPVPDKVAIQDAYAASETHDEYRAKVDAILGKYFSDQEVSSTPTWGPSNLSVHM